MARRKTKQLQLSLHVYFAGGVRQEAADKVMLGREVKSLQYIGESRDFGKMILTYDGPADAVLDAARKINAKKIWGIRAEPTGTYGESVPRRFWVGTLSAKRWSRRGG